MRMYAGEKMDYPYALQNHEFMEQYLEFEKSEAGRKELEYWENELNDYKTFDISSLSKGEKA